MRGVLGSLLAAGDKRMAKGWRMPVVLRGRVKLTALPVTLTALLVTSIALPGPEAAARETQVAETGYLTNAIGCRSKRDLETFLDMAMNGNFFGAKSRFEGECFIVEIRKFWVIQEGPTYTKVRILNEKDSQVLWITAEDARKGMGQRP